ncbi:MAG: chromosome segregation protein SMC [DPANN group archaeon]|nr:chromosome segregation protein SMC [DPANN group archaeon]
MTRINKIVMTDFKSFSNKTELDFGKNFNCILGPNGSGKSNVLDAICFVLGKGSSKGLRVEKATNLIYNGGKTRKPAKKGEVAIYFDNTDKTFPLNEKEVKIARIVRSTGQSEYRINDKRRTRAQVLDLLSVARINPDGYNIILQGDIISFVEMSPERRRMTIEEVSGISIYEEKKKKAMNELNKVEAKFQESEIIMNERKSRLRELKTDRDQAIKSKEVDDQLKSTRSTLLSIRIENRKGRLAKLEKSRADAKDRMEKLTGRVSDILGKITGKRDEVKQTSHEIEEKGETESLAIQKEIESLKMSLAANQERIASVKKEISRIREREAQLKSSSRETDQRIKAMRQEITTQETAHKKAEQELSEVRKKIELFKRKNKLDEAGTMEKEITELDRAADEKQEAIATLRERQQELFREKDSLDLQINTLDEKISKVKAVETENKQELGRLKLMKETFKKAVHELSGLLREDEQIVSQLGTARGQLVMADEKLARMHTQQSHLTEKASRSRAIDLILENKTSLKGVRDLVSNIGHVSQKYALALEVAAGPRIKSIVVDDDGVAARCIRFLKDKRSGVATFLPLNKIRPGREPSAEVRSLSKAQGVVGFASDLISYDPEYKKIISYVFGDTLVVRDINAGRRLGIGKARMVTLEGDLLEQSGAMHGGFRQKERKYSFRQDELLKELSSLQQASSDYQALVSKLEKARASNEERITDLRKKKADLEGDIIRLEKSLHLDSSDLESSKKVKSELQEQLGRVEKELQTITDQISSLNKDLAGLKMRKQKLRGEMTDLRNPRLLAELNTYEQKKDELVLSLVEKTSEIKSLRQQIETIMGPEMESTEKILRQHRKEAEDFAEEIKLLQAKSLSQEKELKEKEKLQASFYKQFRGLFEKRDRLQEEVRKLEERLKEDEFKIKDMENRINNISLDHARISSELTGLEAEYEQFKEYPKISGKTEQELQMDYTNLNARKLRLGNVNMRALELYDRVEKEFNELVKKKELLMAEREDVIMMMNEIETKKTGLFLKSFDRVNEDFKNIFGQLSTKGEAFLELEVPEHPFEGGVRINVRITGKKFLDIRSLSGGEKTLTALAFIFAIQEDDPASFYVLDEVDAALDKRNSEKLSALINRYSERSQYVVISHNDGIISSAGSLYGISMDQHGQSKVVSLKI